MDWERMFGKDVTNKGLILKIYKQFIQLNYKKTNNSVKKGAKDLNRHGQLANEKTLNISNYQRNANPDYREGSQYLLTLVRMVITKKSTNNQCWRVGGEKGTLLHY